MLDIISIISLIIVICLLRRISGILPSVFSCLVRWKECVNIDSSLKSSRDRDITALTLFIPFCLLLSRYDIVSFRFMKDFSPEMTFGVTVCYLILYMVFRAFMTNVVIPGNKRSRVADRSERSFFIIMAICVSMSSWIIGMTNAAYDTIRLSIIWISVAIYTLYLLRKFQIFQSNHSIFTSFLYLCALEIIPTGTFVISVIIF